MLLQGLEKIKITFKLGLSISAIGLILSGCSDGGGSDFASLDSSAGAEKVPCSIKGKSPESQTMKVAAASGTKTLFSITPSTSSCKISYYINGLKSSTTSSAIVEIDSSSLNAGSNTIRVEANNDLGSDYYEWTVTKNTPPSCSRTLPSTGTLNLSNSTTQSFTVNGSGEADESLSFTWKVDGSTSDTLVPTITSSTASQALFTTNGSMSGLKSIDAVVSDGYDTTTCSWTASIGTDCNMSGKTPNTASVRMPFSAGSTSIFSVTTNSPSCLVSWKVNGVDVSGNGTSKTIVSSELLTGSNILTASVTNSSGTTTETWAVIKNSPPSCSQTPATSGTSIAVTSTQNFTANLSDANSDTMSWNWFLNGSAAANPPIAITNGSNTTTAAFTPTAGLVGYNTLTLNVSDGYDSTTCTWTTQVVPQCSILATNPSSSTLTIPNLATTVNPFAITPSDGSCSISWSLNGINLGTSLSLVNLLSSSFATSNTLTVTASNGSSSSSQTWNITKNTPPSCSSQSPVGNVIFGVGSNQNFSVSASDPNAGQTMTFSWLLDGSTPNPAYFTPTNLSTSTSAVWSGLSGQLGNHNLIVNMNDGYDTTQCSWPVELIRTCAVSSSTPAGATLKVANLGTTTTNFGAVANDPSCDITWKLNGTTISSSVNFQSFLSSSLSATNTIQAVLTNPVSTVTRSWTVNKNNPPLCSAQTPSSTGNSLTVGTPQAFNMTGSDGDSDSLTYTWALNGGNSGLFTSVSSAGYTASATLNPGLGQVGNGQTITATMSDGYDTAVCSWAADIIDPNSATIVSFTPVSNPVVIPSAGSQTFTVSASGTGLTYAWQLDGVTQAGMTTASATFSYSDMSVGNHTIKVIVTDTYSNTDEHTFNVKRNAKPTLSAFSPNVSGVNAYRVNYTKTYDFSVTATDGNGDTLTYTWMLDNAVNAKVTTNGADNLGRYSPGGDSLQVGSHTVRVDISDGYETTTKTWNVMTNYLSDECNDLFNSSPTGANGGRVCTIIGNPSMGHTEDIATDPTLLKSRPFNFIEIATGIYAISDRSNHVIILYNSNSSGNFTGLGVTVAPKTAKVVIGNGAAGRNDDASLSAGTDVFQNVGSPAVSMPVFKLNNPSGLAYDSVRSILYITDYSNHRVLALNGSGKVVRILGQSGGNATNVTASNTDNGYGQNHSCNAPAAATMSGRYLYVACYGQHVVKRVNVDDPTDTTNYTKTVTIAGRQSTTGANSVPGSGWAMPDGPGGGDITPATGATVYTASPYAIDADANGLVYWIERVNGTSHGNRIKVYNGSGSPITIYSSLTSDHTSATALSFNALDLSTTGQLANYNAVSTQAVNVTNNTVNALQVGSMSRMVNGGCHAVSVGLLNGATPISSASASTITMSANFAANFYSDDACSSALPSNQFTIPAGDTHKTVYIKPTTNNTYTITATYPGPITATSSPVVSAVGATPTRVVVFAAPKFKYDECLPVEFQLWNASNATTASGATRYVAPAHNNFGTFYSDATCTTVMPRMTFGATDYNKFAYYKRHVYLPNGWVGSMGGYDNTGPGSFNEYANATKIGAMKLTSPTGFAVLRNGGTGYPDYFFIATDTNNYDSISLINISGSSQSYSGRTFANNQANMILARPDSIASPTYTSQGFNGDDQAAWGSAVQDPYGVSVNLARDAVLVADYSNYRGRKIELDTNGFVRQLIGLGRDRWRANVTAIDSTQVALYNPYKIEHLGGYIYFSELSNHRIRRMNITTGITEVIAGNGYASSYTEGNDAIAEGMRNPRGFKVIPYPSAASPTNYVLFYTERNGSTTCLVRAVNMSGPTISNFYGVGNLLPGKVKTVAGDTGSGCVTWGSSGNSDGMTAVNAKLFGPEDIAYIDGEIYIIEYDEHCMLRLDINGKLWRPQTGSCASTVPTTQDSTIDNMRTRYPRAFTPDTANPGNYFFVDQYADTTGFVRYINTLTTGVTFKNTVPVSVSARATTVSPVVVKTIYNYTASSGASNIGGVASWTETVGSQGSNDKVCWSAGDLNGGSSGAHSIYCALRYADDDGTLAAGPSNASGIRGGAPLCREQEKIGRLNATFNSPYGLTFDDEGNLYITEYNNHIIRMVRRWW
ncbi:MAG: hypothetical protein FMNOHCHN_03621 [Ignavibacteriaceae bacterium]|nr:hypothetical protein [Ignavibacteriaceae bacterium]